MFGWQWAFYGQSLWADIGWDRIIPTGCASLCRMYPACHKLSISARLSSILYRLIVISVYHWLRNVMSMTDYVQIWWSFQVGSKTVIWRKKTILLAFSKHLGPPTVSIRCSVLVSCTWPSSQSQAMMDHGLTIHGLRVSFMGIYLEYIHRLIDESGYSWNISIYNYMHNIHIILYYYIWYIIV